MTQQGNQERYCLFDALRGFSLISMILYHFCYDVFVAYGRDPGFCNYPAAFYWQQSICWVFICLSGFVWSWGRKTNIRRGLLINLYGLVITLVTALAMPSEIIWFGVLNLIGCSILLLIPLEKLLRRLPAGVGVCASMLLFLFCKNIQMGWLGFFGKRLVTLPRAWYSTRLFTPFGFPYPEFYSSDYFPILPWFFLFVTGYFLQRLFKAQVESGNEVLREAARIRIPLLSAIGQKSIWIYLAHQPICMLICIVIFHG